MAVSEIGPKVAKGVVVGEVHAATSIRPQPGTEARARAEHAREAAATEARATGRGAQPSDTRAHRASPPRTVVRAQRTATHPTDFRAALGRAHEHMTGKEAPAALLDVLTAHVSHETASGTKMYNYNFGGIKGAGSDGLTARYRTTEYLRGGKTKLVDGFRAYRSLDDGAKDYLSFLRGRYHKAFAHAETGDVDGFSRALKDKGYYTAPAHTYARAMRHHIAHPSDPTIVQANVPTSALTIEMQAGAGARYLYGTELAKEGGYDPLGPSELPTAVNVARVMDAMSGLAARIGAPVEDAQERWEGAVQ